MKLQKNGAERRVDRFFSDDPALIPAVEAVRRALLAVARQLTQAESADEQPQASRQ